jgi:hypothetical protein
MFKTFNLLLPLYTFHFFPLLTLLLTSPSLRRRLRPSSSKLSGYPASGFLPQQHLGVEPRPLRLHGASPRASAGVGARAPRAWRECGPPSRCGAHLTLAEAIIALTVSASFISCRARHGTRAIFSGRCSKHSLTLRTRCALLVALRMLVIPSTQCHNSPLLTRCADARRGSFCSCAWCAGRMEHARRNGWRGRRRRCTLLADSRLARPSLGCN